MQLFSRSSYYAKKAELEKQNPFDLKAFDFPLTGFYGRVKLANLRDYLLASCDSLRMALCLNADGRACAISYQGPAPEVLAGDFDPRNGRPPDIKSVCARFYPVINLYRGPVAQFIYYYDANAGLSMFRIVCSHFAIDEISYRIVKGLVQSFDREGPASVVGSSYLDWMAAYLEYAEGRGGERELDYWESISAVEFRDVQRRMESGQAMTRRRVVLDIPECSFGLSGEPAVRVEFLCSAAIMRGLTEIFNLSSVPIEWTASARYPVGGQTFSQTVGWLSDTHPLLFSPPAGGLRSVAADIRNRLFGTPMLGGAFNWVTEFGRKGSAAALAKALRTPFVINVRQQSRWPNFSTAHDELKAGDFPLSGQSIIEAGIPPRRPRLIFAVSTGPTARITLESLTAEEKGLDLPAKLMMRIGGLITAAAADAPPKIGPSGGPDGQL